MRQKDYFDHPSPGHPKSFLSKQKETYKVPYETHPADRLAQISELFAQFSENAKLQIEKGNKAAGMRARKASLELEKLLKQFRKESLEASK